MPFYNLTLFFECEDQDDADGYSLSLSDDTTWFTHGPTEMPEITVRGGERAIIVGMGQDEGWPSIAAGEYAIYLIDSKKFDAADPGEIDE